MSGRRRQPRALVTRPRADAGEIVAELRDRGFEVVLEPLLKIQYIAGTKLLLDGVIGLIFTSANGVRAFVRRSERRELSVYAVGDATARTARNAGFLRVQSAGGNVESLVSLIRREVQAQQGRLLHIAASEVAGNLREALAAEGYEVDRIALYEAVTAQRLGTRTRRLLGSGGIDVVLLFSPRTAQTFVNLAEGCDLIDTCQAMTAVCLSSAVAAAVASLPWKQVRTADEPTMTALLAALEEVSLACNDSE